MPRTGRGGVRQGTPGTAYGNRTDLNAALPVQAATGQGYGEAGAQQAAQRAIPVAPQQVSVAAPQAPAQGQPAPTTITGQMPTLPSYPGELKFDHPTDRPDEPITAGLNIGDGAGPEAMHTFTPTVGRSLDMMASAPGASAMLMDLARAARNIGL